MLFIFFIIIAETIDGASACLIKEVFGETTVEKLYEIYAIISLVLFLVSLAISISSLVPNFNKTSKRRAA